METLLNLNLKSFLYNFQLILIIDQIHYIQVKVKAQIQIFKKKIKL